VVFVVFVVEKQTRNEENLVYSALLYTSIENRISFLATQVYH
jgi:hypothetical protein